MPQTAAGPGKVYPYDEIAAALGRGTDRTFDRHAVQVAVRQANRQLLRTQARYLRNVRGVGYLIAYARDHAEIAGNREERSRRQWKWALETLRHARREEMNERERGRHEAQLIVNAEMYAHFQWSRRKFREHDQAIAKLTHRMEQSEAKVDDLASKK